MITLDAIKALSWRDNAAVHEGEDRRYRITVEVHPDRLVFQHFYTIKRGFGKVSIAKTPERAMFYVKQRRAMGKR